ncbi:ngr1 protein [Malassezia pachydermatis]|uniref:Ngr1 protein n=1 Tax=Malassezia pachydermatis TaxID=77020 RepID=A0A0M8MX32_9BASI|nr:ngr1 protein [Malassezia pachydermatis]KOS15550.1 ngr1 protein [Malassezia pachydermatis]
MNQVRIPSAPPSTEGDNGHLETAVTEKDATPWTSVALLGSPFQSPKPLPTLEAPPEPGAWERWRPVPSHAWADPRSGPSVPASSADLPLPVRAGVRQARGPPPPPVPPAPAPPAPIPPVPAPVPRAPAPTHAPASTNPSAPCASGSAGTLFSIFVGGLDPLVTEEDLMEHFSHPSPWPDDHPMYRMYAHIRQATGPTWQIPTQPAAFQVHSCKIIRDSTSQTPRVFGFVRLSSQTECDRALIEMQRTCLVPRRAPHMTLRLYLGTASAPRFDVEEMPKKTSRRFASTPDMQKSTAAAPEPHGRRTSGSTAPGRHSAPATTTAPTSSVAREALAKGSPQVPATTEGAPTVLTFVSDAKGEGNAKEQPHLASALKLAHTSSALDPNNTTVFVGSLFSMATESTLQSLFSRFGPIQSINIPRGQDCGFVQFARKQDAARAIAEMQGYQVAGGALRLSWGRSIGEKAAARAAVRAGLRWVEDATTPRPASSS